MIFHCEFFAALSLDIRFGLQTTCYLVDQYDLNIQELMETNVINHLVLFIYLIEPLFNKNWFLNPNPTHSFIALGL